jgi:hypothetical protein
MAEYVYIFRIKSAYSRIFLAPSWEGGGYEPRTLLPSLPLDTATVGPLLTRRIPLRFPILTKFRAKNLSSSILGLYEDPLVMSTGCSTEKYNWH